jgi:hypothetical protein
MSQDHRLGQALADRLDRLILKPSAGLRDVARLRNALLLGRLLAAMFVVFAALDAHYLLTVPGYAVPWYGYLFLAGSFALNRVGWYRASSWLVMMMFPVTIFSGIVAATAVDPVGSLSYLFLSLLAGGILLSKRSLAIFIVVEITGLLYLPLLAPRAIPGLGSISTQLVIMIIGGALVMLWKYQRDVIETERSALLRAAEQKYRELVETTGTGYVILDTEGRVLDANQEYLRLTGRARMDDVVGHGILEWTAPNHQAYNAEQVRSCLDLGYVRNLEIDYIGPGGKITPVEVNATLLRFPNSESIVTLCRDVTARREAEQEDRRREAKLASIFRASPVGIGMVINRVLQEVNDTLCRMTGYSPEELVGKSARLLYPTEEDFAYVGAEKYRRIARNGVGTVETRWRTKEGRIIDILLSSSPLEVGDLSKGVTFTALDISDRKRAEEALRESERRFRAIFDSTFQFIGLLWPDGILLEANQTALDFSGQSAEEVIEKPFWEARWWAGSPRIQTQLKEAIARAAEGQFVRYEVVFLGKGDRTATMDFSLTPVKDETGRVTVIIPEARDITDRKRAEEELRQAKLELEQRLEELKKLDIIKDGLLRDVTHELKTPVAKQAMQIELLRAALGRDCTARSGRIIEVMEQSVRRQERVIRNLLDLSRLEAGGRRMTIRPVRIDEIVDSVLKEYQSALEETGMEVGVTVPPLVVSGDAEMLWHVFANLVGNAIKFRKAGGPGRLEISADREGEMTVLRFRDRGIGLAPEEQASAFERFYQAAPSVEGSGVGLSICRMIITELGGTITLESEGSGAGATATVSLPSAK